MPAPSVASTGTYSVGSGATRTPGHPTGVVSGQFVLITAGVPANAGGEDAAGFLTLLETASATIPNILVYYKVSSTTDSGGTYTVTVNAGATNAGAIASRIIDVDTANPFFGSTSHAPSSTITTGAVSLTSVPADALLVWICHCANARSVLSFPTGFVEQTPTGNQFFHWAVKTHAGGDTGSLTATLSNITNSRAALIAILSPAASTNGGAAFLGIL